MVVELNLGLSEPQPPFRFRNSHSVYKQIMSNLVWKSGVWNPHGRRDACLSMLSYSSTGQKAYPQETLDSHLQDDRLTCTYMDTRNL